MSYLFKLSDEYKGGLLLFLFLFFFNTVLCFFFFCPSAFIFLKIFHNKKYHLNSLP